MLTDKKLVYCKETRYIYDESTIRRLLYSCGITNENVFKKLYVRITRRQIISRLRKGEQLRVAAHDKELSALHKKFFERGILH